MKTIRNTAPATCHVITHTHWDRDWFLPAEHTSVWLDDLFDRLFGLIERVPAYRFVFDGQTNTLEDFLKRRPDQLSLLQKCTRAGNILTGPYYGAIDWRASCEEALMRNLHIGIRDGQAYGNLLRYGWLVDNFGYCSQTPQIHTLFGIDEVFVWRGPVFADDRINAEFNWVGSDGSQVLAHFLFSGYRNFYNLTDTQDYVGRRIQQLVEMLEPFTPHGQLLFLDGYDLDIWPEDPFQYIEGRERFIRSTPARYSEAVRQTQNLKDVPTIEGELYSGKYACIFPGSLSARAYLRVENALVERLLAYYLGPLEALLSRAGSETNITETESWWRSLLTTQLHDCIGGVSVDQVHDKMESTYKQLYAAAKARIDGYLQQIPALLDLQRGMYAYTPSPFAYEQLWLTGDGRQLLVDTAGMGFYQVKQVHVSPETGREIDTFTWTNDFYTVRITREGIWFNSQAAGELILEQDRGDTYNSDPLPFADAPQIRVTSLRLLDEQEHFARIGLAREIRQGDIHIRTEEELFLSRSPLLSWKLAVDSWGTSYRLRFAFRTEDTVSDVSAKMPFATCRRPRVDRDYFGEEVPRELRPVLLAARETGTVADFPFQGFVALSDGERTRAVLARGLREYQVDEQGTILITLKRSMEWLAKSNLSTRIGDAGPTMYVPGAKDERRTEYELAIVDVQAGVQSPDFLKWFYLFEYGFLVFDNRSHDGQRSDAQIWQDTLPWSGVHTQSPACSLVRVYNPFAEPVVLSPPRRGSDPLGQERREVSIVAPNQIEHLLFEPTVSPLDPLPLADRGNDQNIPVTERALHPTQPGVQLLVFPLWPVGDDHSVIDEGKLAQLRARIETLRQEQSDACQRLARLSEKRDPLAYHRTQHSIIRLEREILEGETSLLLNELKQQGASPELRQRIQAVGTQLNLVRRQRRTYDYILSLFESQSW